MNSLQQRFTVTYEYPVHFTTDVFDPQNPLLRDVLLCAGEGPHRMLFVVDENVASSNPGLADRIQRYVIAHRSIMQMTAAPLILPGGEAAKHGDEAYRRVSASIHDAGICRQSFVVAVGGGALLDLVGFAAATAHRGVRLIRMPTTVLAQDDSGVGVKNSINAFDKKNFLGTFAPPFAILNDFAFLRSLPQRDWIAGLAEAIKVALLKDAAYFRFLEQRAADLVNRNEGAMQHVIYRSAELHLQHIGKGGDPFETTSSRPLDFGHWAAHKLEQMTGYTLRHGEAVAIGLALDCTYAYNKGMLAEQTWRRVLSLLARLGFSLEVPVAPAQMNTLLGGLAEFREHLGGELTITLLRDVGDPVEVHEIEEATMIRAAQALREHAWEHEAVNA